jgi:hypothetical protein
MNRFSHQDSTPSASLRRPVTLPDAIRGRKRMGIQPPGEGGGIGVRCPCGVGVVVVFIYQLLAGIRPSEWVGMLLSSFAVDSAWGTQVERGKSAKHHHDDVFAMRNSFLYFRFAQMRRSQPRFRNDTILNHADNQPLWLYEANAMLINGTSQDQKQYDDAL